MSRGLDIDEIEYHVARIVEKAKAIDADVRRELVFAECKELIDYDYDWSEVDLVKGLALRELRIHLYGPDPS